jgi:protein-S-isoprenylcysteine O-methyltransferase Ste14
VADEGRRATAGVGVAPPALFAGMLGFGLIAGALPRSATYGPRIRRILGTLSIATGLGVGLSAIASVKRAGSNVNPYAPTNALVTGGVYRATRNPMYFGFTSIYIGVAMLARSMPAFVLLPITLAILDRSVVDKEEAYLERLFGDEYRAYRATAPRWF